MPQFGYSAYTLEQGIVKGRLDARNEAEARSEIARLGLKLLRLRAMRKPLSKEDVLPSLFRVQTGELVRFSRQLAIMISSGGSLLKALEMMSRESRNATLRRTLSAVRESLDQGEGFSAALAQHPQVFGPLYLRVVEIGEHTGRLAPSLEQLADMLEKEQTAKQRATRTLMYPVAIMALSILTMGVLMVVAMPPLLRIFSQTGAEVPTVTRMVVAAAAFGNKYAVHMAAGAAVAVLLIMLMRRYPRTRLWLDVEATRIPVMGNFIVAGELSRLARTLAMLIEAGVPLATALKLGTNGCKNLALQRSFADAEENLLSGGGVAEALKRHVVLPSMFVELVLIGEQSNSLRRTMTEAANAYQKQLEQGLDALLGILEPASTVVVGGIVALIAFAMFVPIYSGLDAIG